MRLTKTFLGRRAKKRESFVHSMHVSRSYPANLVSLQQTDCVDTSLFKSMNIPRSFSITEVKSKLLSSDDVSVCVSGLTLYCTLLALYLGVYLLALEACVCDSS